MRDVTFQSAAPNRDMPYRVVLPLSVVAGQKLPVVYWLHGGGGGFRDWSNSDVAQFAERGLVLVMPEGNSSYYSNSVDRPQERYGDSIVGDLIVDVESKFPRLQVGQAPLHRPSRRTAITIHLFLLGSPIQKNAMLFSFIGRPRGVVVFKP